MPEIKCLPPAQGGALEQTNYELMAFLVHYGPSLEGGHYIAYVRDASAQQWFQYNDAKSTKVSPCFQVLSSLVFRVHLSNSVLCPVV